MTRDEYRRVLVGQTRDQILVQEFLRILDEYVERTYA